MRYYMMKSEPGSVVKKGPFRGGSLPYATRSGVPICVSEQQAEDKGWENFNVPVPAGMLAIKMDAPKQSHGLVVSYNNEGYCYELDIVHLLREFGFMVIGKADNQVLESHRLHREALSDLTDLIDELDGKADDFGRFHQVINARRLLGDES